MEALGTSVVLQQEEQQPQQQQQLQVAIVIGQLISQLSSNEKSV